MRTLQLFVRGEGFLDPHAIDIFLDNITFLPINLKLND